MLQLKVATNAYPLCSAPRTGLSSIRANSSLNSLPAGTPLPPRPLRSTSLAGTVPEHSSYLFLHARDPPSTWPPVFNSELYVDLRRRMKEKGGLVNFCWPPTSAVTNPGSGEAYTATLWQKIESQIISYRRDIPIISARNAEGVVETIGRNIDSGLVEAVASSGPYFYICTHGNRDCRCGIRGLELIGQLRKELSRRGMLFDRSGKPRVAEVGHVGGHKNAPNLLVFPYGDWYGNLEPTDVSGLIDHYIHSLEERPIPSSILDGPNRFQWRGRMGMTKKEQTDAFHSLEWGATDLLGFSGLL